ncbi:MAG: hypothetical protein Q8S33_32045 [Myxococcales bacterium]|nr:hypothetical protein [Myxococcales bacterium]
MVLLTRLFDVLHAAFESARHRRLLSIGLVGAFGLALFVIELGQRSLLGERFQEAMPRSHFHAIDFAFNLLLAYEVTGLVFALARSVANAAGKQFEIFSLILLRHSFEPFGRLDEPVHWEQAREAVVPMLSYAGGALLIFVGLGFYYAGQEHRPLSDDARDRDGFIAAKKVLALVLLGVLVGLAVRSLAGFASTLHTEPFFEPFYTVLIFADVLVVLFSLRYSASYLVVFRNSGLAVATVLLRLALSYAYHRFAPVLEHVEDPES